MNKGQIMSAIGNLEESLRLFHEAEKQLGANGIQICGVNPCWLGQDTIHIWCGIDELAEVVGEEVIVDVTSPNMEKTFVLGGKKFFQIRLEDGTYRERKVCPNDLSDC